MGISQNFAKRVGRMKPAAIRGILARMGPDCISLAAGKPAESLFPLETIYEKTGHMLEKNGPESMQYFSTTGFEPLREWVASRVPGAKASNVLPINGSQQAIDIMGKLFVDPGDKVAVSAPTYTAAFSTLDTYEAEFIAVDSDTDGMIPESVEAVLQQAPKFLYCIPNFMNPTGVCMTLERRQAIVDLARQYQVPILEDDPYGDLRFEGEPLPNLFELAPEQVIYAGTFSKILAPGFRVGWMISSDEVFNELMMTKQVSDLQVSTYAQMLLYEVVQGGFIEGQIERICAYYKKQRDTMLAAMDKHFPEGVTYERPSGGMFIWCELPEHLDATEIVADAIAADVAYVPGEPFFPPGQGKNTLRLSYSMASLEEIEVGIKRLGKVFKKAIANEPK
ncbi:MAG: PLP-dependent aminotransferase family protein [Chloroflexota bacterium]